MTKEQLEDPNQIFEYSDTEFNIAVGIKSTFSYGLPKTEDNEFEKYIKIYLLRERGDYT